MDSATRQEALTALQWYVDHGVDIVLGDESIDRTAIIEQPSSILQMPTVQSLEQPQQQAAFLGTSDALKEAIAAAKRATTLEELREEIANFEGISIKKTASNLVFADGNPKASVMMIGEAPETDEDRNGKPFMGANGQLLDNILTCIGLDRNAEDPEKSVYLSNILNWRPPGNRTPTAAEIELSLPFIERHIQITNPKVLVLFGGVAAKSLLGSTQSISKLRRAQHEYSTINQELKSELTAIPCIATYHPSYLLRTPAQKKHVWADALNLHKKLSLL